MKLFSIICFICFIIVDCVGQAKINIKKKYFSYDITKIIECENDSICFFLAKVDVKRNGIIKNFELFYYKNDSILKLMLDVNIFNYTIKEIYLDYADTLLTFNYLKKHKLLIPYIFKNLNKNEEYVYNIPFKDIFKISFFTANDIEKVIELIQKAQFKIKINYKITEPIIRLRYPPINIYRNR